MFLQELSCIEVLLNHLTSNSELSREIFTSFSSTKTFDNKRGNLFNIISINNLVENYTPNAPFSLERFVQNGVIKGMYDKPTQTPLTDGKNLHNARRFIAELVQALKEENYLFDDDNNVYISTGKLEATIPEAWLYRLAEGYKRKQFKKLYFYNKNQESDISDKITLIDYLRHTKTFLVSMSSETQDDYDIEFAKAEALTNNEVKNEPVVRVEDLIKIFRRQISREYKVEIDRYKLADLFFIVSRAEKMGNEFYTKPLEEQKKDINRWLIELIDSNKKSKESAQEYLLIGKEPETREQRKEIILGLINLYLQLIKNYELDFDDISLTDFKIATYMPMNLQTDLQSKKILIQGINRLRNELQELKREIEIQNGVLDSLELNSGMKFEQTKYAIEELVEDYRNREKELLEYQKTYNYLQEKIRTVQKDSLLDISFANNEIVALLIEAALNGRISLSSNDSTITFELYNNQLGKTTFKATIKTEDFLTLVENINYSLTEGMKNSRN